MHVQKDHKFPMRRNHLVCVIGVHLQNFLTLQTLEVSRLDIGKGLYSTTMMLVYFYTRPLSEVNQLEVEVYQ